MKIVLKNHGARVKMHAMSPQCVLAMVLLGQLEIQGRAEITSVSDGSHSGKSKHYTGDAFDFKMLEYRLRDKAWGESESLAEAAAEALAIALGPDFDVIAEATHIHVEYDPKDGPR